MLPSWLTVVPAILIVGTRYYALAIIGHDGLHRRMFPDQWTNDLFNDLLIMGPIGAITRVNRLNHIEHHRITASTADPDRHKYLHDGKEHDPPIPRLPDGSCQCVAHNPQYFSSKKAGRSPSFRSLSRSPMNSGTSPSSWLGRQFSLSGFRMRSAGGPIRYCGSSRYISSRIAPTLCACFANTR